MENASKALIIAGGVLIAILILTVGVVLYNAYAEISERQNKTWSVDKIQSINADYLKYEERKDIVAEEIVTCINCAKEYNLETAYPITVYVGTKEATKWELEDINEFIKINQTYQKNEINASGNPEIVKKNLYENTELNLYDNGQVKEIKFKKN